MSTMQTPASNVAPHPGSAMPTMYETMVGMAEKYELLYVRDRINANKYPPLHPTRIGVAADLAKLGKRLKFPTPETAARFDAFRAEVERAWDEGEQSLQEAYGRITHDPAVKAAIHELVAYYVNSGFRYCGLC